MPICTKCGGDGPFYSRVGVPMRWCKECFNEANRRSYMKNREARIRRRVLAERAKQLGMTYEEYMALPVDPGTQCAICGATPDSRRNGRFSNGTKTGRRRLAIDHSHRSGERRGFLCSNCNNGLGRFDDDPKLLRAAADYLERGPVAPI